MKAAGWNPDLSTNTKPTELWEDQRKDGNMKSMTSSDQKQLIEDEISNVESNNNEWIKTAKDQEGWKKMENKFAIAAAAPPGTGTSAEGERLTVYDT